MIDRRRLPFPNTAYGPFRAVVNWLTIPINTEEESLNAFAMTPGWVTTELSYGRVKVLGFDDEFIKVNLISMVESCDGVMEADATTSKVMNGGKLVQHDGGICEW